MRNTFRNNYFLLFSFILKIGRDFKIRTELFVCYLPHLQKNCLNLWIRIKTFNFDFVVYCGVERIFPNFVKLKLTYFLGVTQAKRKETKKLSVFSLQL